MMFARFVLLVMTACGAIAANAQSSRPSDFALLDHHGQYHQLSRLVDDQAAVLLMIKSGDKASQETAQELVRIAARFADQGLRFFLITPSPTPQPELLKQEMSEIAVDLPVLLDRSQIVSTSIGFSEYAQAAVLDPESHEVLYLGPVLNESGAAALGSALEAILSGARSASAPVLNAGAEAVEYSYKKRFEAKAPSYSEDIAPILLRRCAYCHVEGGLAPWAMRSHRMIQGWSPMVREVLLTKRMPPGQLDKSVGEWTHDNAITPEEVATLVYWIDSGARNEGDADPLAEATQARAQEDAWALGEPDLIVDIPPQQVPATGVVDFRYEYAELGLTQDKWLSAVAYDAGEKSVLHSVMVYALAADASTLDPTEMTSPDNAHFISIFVPGQSEDQFSSDSGLFLPAGSKLAFKIRYVSSGREVSDSTRVGLYFRDKPFQQVEHIPLHSNQLQIAAGDANHTERVSSLPLETDVYMEAVAPQMHGRGISMRLFLGQAGQEPQELLNVANYNFNWQLNYRLQEPLLIPRGAILEAETVYDNSTANVYNPDPEQTAVFGPTTWDEVLSHYVRVVKPLQ
ncbi:MAG: hypothetical protein R3332_13370 [Pseudohongiellaceae bacterium]|nr:hypothetical protein [Pseudohongiellaceae bacterium]